MQRDEKPTIVVTGFGPFGKHTINASWEAVKYLKTLDLETKYDVNLVILDIPVIYEIVCSKVNELWEQFRPALVFHVGVSCVAERLKLESRAHKIGYVQPDVEGKLPEERDQEQRILEPEIDVKELATAINDNFETNGCKADVSSNAGRYICEFTFFQSLSREPGRVIFVHVPDFNVYETKRVALGLYDAIRFALERVKSVKNKCSRTMTAKSG